MGSSVGLASWLSQPSGWLLSFRLSSFRPLCLCLSVSVSADKFAAELEASHQFTVCDAAAQPAIASAPPQENDVVFVRHSGPGAKMRQLTWRDGLYHCTRDRVPSVGVCCRHILCVLPTRLLPVWDARYVNDRWRQAQATFMETAKAIASRCVEC